MRTQDLPDTAGDLHFIFVSVSACKHSHAQKDATGTQTGARTAVVIVVLECEHVVLRYLDQKNKVDEVLVHRRRLLTREAKAEDQRPSGTGLSRAAAPLEAAS